MSKKKRIIRILICFLLVLSICIGTVGCNLKSDYKLIEIEGKHYLVFDDISLYFNSNEFLESDIEFIEKLPADMTFDSLKEFKGIVTGGALTIAQKKRVAEFAKDNKNRIKIFDFDQLYYPITLDGNSLTRVTWYTGQSYYFDFKTDIVQAGRIFILSEDDYYEDYKMYYANFFDSSTMSLVDVVYDATSNQEIIYYTSYQSATNKTVYQNFKRVRYSLELGDKIFHVDKVFLINGNTNGGKYSGTVPYSLDLYCEEDGQKYRIGLGNLKQDLSDERLLQFSIKKYTEKK